MSPKDRPLPYLDRLSTLAAVVSLALASVVLYDLTYWSETVGREPSAKALEFVFDTVSVMTPVITGYLMLLVGAVGQIWLRRALRFKNPQLAKLSQALVLGIVSMGIYSGAMAFCIQAARTQQGFYLWGGMLSAQAGHVLFFLSVATALRFAYLIFLEDPKKAR